MNYIKSNDFENVNDKIKFVHYMIYSKEKGGHPELKKRTCLYSKIL